MNDPSTPNTIRQIRVFISSTFRDMQEDRDNLIKRIFPQLRKLCEQRLVTWTEVDLRWGITTEQAAEGKVLPLCLEEIQRCRPYFIGLLGERYGWVPEPNSIPADLYKSQPWLKEHLQCSVTEMEILHGVFSEEPMHRHAYFYFRDSKYLESLPPEKRQDFTTENAEAAVKLGRLKQKIRAARDEQICELRVGYANPEQLGEWILEDFIKLIDRLFPQDQIPELMDQEAAHHEAYAQSRRFAFVGREDLIRCLNEHAIASGKPLVLIGESGCGKSALLAEWVGRWKKSHPDDLIIQHYIGSTLDSADWHGIVRRILAELKRAFVITEEIPLQPDALRVALNDWTVKAAGSRRVVLVLDGLNQLSDDGTALQLGWLPFVFPNNFCVLLSSLPGETLDTLRRRGWSELNVPLFARTDIAPAVFAYNEIFSKTPPPGIVAQLEATPAACNALYLRAVLDELRQFGKHEELEAKAAEYLAAPDPQGLYKRILQRWELDFGAELVCKSLRFIWAARCGLSEAELLDLLGKDGQPLPHATWTPFYLAAESSLVIRSGLLTFGHDFLRGAVNTEVFYVENDRRSAHVLLADYFETQSSSKRRREEFPWQLNAVGQWSRLAAHLSDPLEFPDLWAEHRLDVLRYWQDIEQHSPIRIPSAWGPVIENPSKYEDVIESLYDLFFTVGYLREAEALNYAIVFAGHTTTDRLAHWIVFLRNQASILISQNSFEGALKVCREAARICRESDAMVGLPYVLALEAIALLRLGKAQEALKVSLEAERTCHAIHDTRDLEKITIDRAVILSALGNFEGAKAIYRNAETEARESGHQIGIQWALKHQGDVLRYMGQNADALASYRKAESIARELGVRIEILNCVLNQAEIHRESGAMENALSLWQEAERLCLELGNEQVLLNILRNLLVAHLEMGIARFRASNFDSAMPHLRDAERISRQLATKEGLVQALGYIALILKSRGAIDEALSVHQEEERLCRELGNDVGLSHSLIDQAGILCDRGKVTKGLDLYRQAEEVARRLGDKSILLIVLFNSALTLFCQNQDPGGALPKCQEALRLTVELKKGKNERSNVKSLLMEIEKKLNPP